MSHDACSVVSGDLWADADLGHGLARVVLTATFNDSLTSKDKRERATVIETA
jgi:hypothetical protein